MCVDETRGNRPPTALMTLAAAVLAAGTCCVAPAHAETPGETGEFDAAIASMRAAGACPALLHDPNVQRAAEISNRSTADYLNHTAQYVPVSDPLAVLKDLGSDATKAVQLQGSGHADGAAIKGALLQGHSAISDCTYTHFGTSVLTNPDRDHTIVVAVLAAF